MKNTAVTSLIAAALIATTATFAQAATFDFPIFYPEFTEKAVQPTTKLDINTTSSIVENQTKVGDKK